MTDVRHGTQLPSLRSPAGQTLVEYAVVLFLLALAVFAVTGLIRL